MYGNWSNLAGSTALILSIMACALTTQSSAQEGESLDAIERRLIEHYNIREGNVAMRDAPGWAPLKKIVVRDIYGPGSLGTTAARLEWISEVAPGVEFGAVESLQEAIDNGLLLDAQAVSRAPPAGTSSLWPAQPAASRTASSRVVDRRTGLMNIGNTKAGFHKGPGVYA